jgi:hypothetical protein
VNGWDIHLRVAVAANAAVVLLEVVRKIHSFKTGRG